MIIAYLRIFIWLFFNKTNKGSEKRNAWQILRKMEVYILEFPFVLPVKHFPRPSNFCQIFLRHIIQNRHTFILCRFSVFLGNHFPNYFFQPSNLIFCAILRLFIFEKFDTRTFCMEKKKSAITQTLTQPDASDRLLTRSEVAEYLNIGTTFIEQLRRQGKLPSYRLSGKCIRYKKSDCDVLLDHCFIVRPAKSAKKGEI